MHAGRRLFGRRPTLGRGEGRGADVPPPASVPSLHVTALGRPLLSARLHPGPLLFLGASPRSSACAALTLLRFSAPPSCSFLSGKRGRLLLLLTCFTGGAWLLTQAASLTENDVLIAACSYGIIIWTVFLALTGYSMYSGEV